MSEITVKTEFKSCPFCSSEDIKVKQMEQDNEINVWVCWCGSCGSLGPPHLNWSGAIEMWNLRRSEKLLLDALKLAQDAIKLPRTSPIKYTLRIIDEALDQVEGDQS